MYNMYLYTPYYMKKNILYILYFLAMLLFLWTQTVSGADDICASELWYALYECRVENICLEYKSPKPTYRVEDYLDGPSVFNWIETKWSPTVELDTAKEIYRENMGNIYKCAIIGAQKNSLEFLWEQLKHESSGQLTDTLWWQIESRINRLDLSAEAIWCILTDRETIQNKLNVLKETSHEICRYTSYLEYMKSYYSNLELQADRYLSGIEEENDIENFINRNIGITELPRVISNIKQDIAEESARSYRVFPLAYHAYSEYENNFPIHFLLEVIRSDFLVVRNRFYWTLMPLAQLGYKVINAMSY